MNSARNRSRCVGVLTAAMLVAACAQAVAASGVGNAEEGALLAQYPGLSASNWNGRTTSFYGRTMNVGFDPQALAAAWVRDHAAAFGVANPDLRAVRSHEVSYGKFHVAMYEQYLDGVPVEFGRLRVLVQNFADHSAVVLASAKLAEPPAQGFRPVTLAADAAVKSVQQRPEYNDLTEWTKAELVVFFGEGDLPHWITPVKAWKFVGELPDPDRYQKYSFFVDAGTGELIYVRNEKYEVDVTGRVIANATPSPAGNAAADHSGNPPTQRGVPNILVRVNGGAAQGYTDPDGNFTIPWAGTAPVTVEASLGNGRWARVQEQNAGVAVEGATTNATPGTPVDLLINPTPSEFTTAQTNGFIHQTITHNHFKDRAPSFTALDTQLPVNTGVSGTCNAFYNGTSTNYYNVGGGCNNTAFSSVVAHEYGHHIVNRLGLAQGAFGEGFGDTMSLMIYQDPVVGRFFRTNGGAVRTPATANQQFPCSSSAIHTCGQILGGTLWDMRNNFVTRHGSTLGIELIRQLHIDWAQITLGGQGLNSAHPDMLIEWLVTDDTDGNLSNGTPNYCEIVGGFAQHGITADTGFTGVLDVAFDGGVPELVPQDRTSTIDLTVTGNGVSITPGQSRLFTSVGGTGGFTQTALAFLGGDRYRATFPAADCGQTIEFYVQFNIPSQGWVSFPSDGCSAPRPLSTIAGSGVSEQRDDFESDRGWTVGPNTATTGIWERGVPIATGAQPGSDVSENGTQCFFTGNDPSGSLGGNDVDGGFTTLTSPNYDVSTAADAEISYYRWYSNGAGATPFTDIFTIDVSVNGGSTWTRAETIGPSGAGTTGGWEFASFRLSDLGLAVSNQVRVRFIADDAGSGSIVEAAVDEFAVRAVQCDAPPACPADWDGSGGVDGDDITAFFTDWQAGDADIDQSGGTDGDDITFFFTRWQAGC